MIFDTHAHYDDDSFDIDRESLIHSLHDNNVGYVCNIGASMAGCRRTLELARKYDFFYGALGVHPSDCRDMTDEDLHWIRENSSDENIVAIGEIGLDYYWDKEPDIKENQKKWFAAQLELAREVNLPFVLHSRDAAKDTVDILREHDAGSIGGVVHCYSYSKEMARDFMKMDLYFGIGGVLTFKNARVLKEAVEYIPMDRIVLETDSPYLAPVPFRGKRNDSTNIKYVVDVISEIKGISAEQVEDITLKNAFDLYRLNK